MVLDPSKVLLGGRVAVVTGAASGIGRATASALARFGADLAVCDRDADRLADLVEELATTHPGCEAPSAVLDVREQPDVEAFCGRVAERFGRIDILVNNAGGGFMADFLDVNAKGQDSLVRENFHSVGHFVRAVVPLMPPTGGSIVNLTSIEAHRAAPGYAVYAAQKAAVASLTTSLALELGPRFIRVNCVAPDVIPTPGIGDLTGPPRTPLPVRGHAEDVAAAIVFLAGELSRFITGTTLHVDGGNLAAGGWHRAEDGGWTT
ncbi:MAG: SDR family NAD(P)-dependent oxidoreductase [Acidimicrobiales bacterium]